MHTPTAKAVRLNSTEFNSYFGDSPKTIAQARPDTKKNTKYFELIFGLRTTSVAEKNIPIAKAKILNNTFVNSIVTILSK